MSAPLRRARASAPILVTGVPRSGTTWVARWLAGGEHMALPGREPMNPRGGYALGGTLDGWARLTTLTPRQSRAVRASYRGLNPWVLSRYGHRQLSAALPSRRVVVKDPFALLSLPALAAATGAHPVVVFRHPGAVLASYRRMGWSSDTEEVQSLLEQARADGMDVADLPRAPGDSPEAMGRFWATLHDIALWDCDRAGLAPTIVSHAELATSGHDGGRVLCDHLGVTWTEEMAAELDREGGAGTSSTDGDSLHRFDRSPVAVADAWRAQVDPEEIVTVERVTAATRARLDSSRLRLS